MLWVTKYTFILYLRKINYYFYEAISSYVFFFSNPRILDKLLISFIRKLFKYTIGHIRYFVSKLYVTLDSFFSIQNGYR